MRTIFALIGATALLAFGNAHAQGGGGGAAHTQGMQGDAARGKVLFVKDGCYECHGYVGQGGPGIRLAPNPLPVAVIKSYIRNPTGEMPPYTSKVVSDQDIVDIHAYLETIKAPPKASDIPELH